MTPNLLTSTSRERISDDMSATRGALVSGNSAYRVPNNEFYTNAKVYDSILHMDFYKEQEKLYCREAYGFKFDFFKKKINKTNLGKLFYEICVREL